MNYDDHACRKADIMYVLWKRRVDKDISGLAAQLAAAHRKEPPTETVHYSQGAFNRCYRVKFRKGADVLIRFPALGRVGFRREQVHDEASIIEYVAQHTSIPVPRILMVNTCSWGPYVVMAFVEGKLLSDYLKAPLDPTKLDVLNPNIDLLTLRKAYRGMAKTLVEMSKCHFSHIGAVTRNGSGHWLIGKRALTLNINQLVVFGNYPPHELPKQTFSTANDYFVALAENHLCHLKTQRNGAVQDEADCRRKYVARCLFRKIARTFSTTHNNGPFRLFCDDFRPSNVIVNANLHIRAVIDWEFCYAGPAEFIYCSPWWLLLTHPDDWESSLDEFLAQYLPRHKVFLEVLQEYEDEAIGKGMLYESRRLSDYMARSIENGDFWFCLAARSSYAFDSIYWRFIDSKYHGDFTSIEERIELLSAEEQDNLENFVNLKMQQAGEGKLDEHRTLDEIYAS